jgi:LysM domain
VPQKQQGGPALGTSYADFDLAYNPINAYEQGSRGGMYSVQSGDTLAGIAAQLWGDSALWYKLAEANGLTATSPLLEGMALIIPAGVQTNANNATTFKPYDPLEVLGATAPTAAAPKKIKCGAMGQILLVVIAIAVVAMTAGGFIGGFASMANGGSFMAGSSAGANASATTAETAPGGPQAPALAARAHASRRESRRCQTQASLLRLARKLLDVFPARVFHFAVGRYEA